MNDYMYFSDPMKIHLPPSTIDQMGWDERKELIEEIELATTEAKEKNG